MRSTGALASAGPSGMASSFNELYRRIEMFHDGKGWRLPPPEMEEIDLMGLLGRDPPTVTHVAMLVRKAESQLDEIRASIDSASDTLQKVMTRDSSLTEASSSVLLPAVILARSGSAAGSATTAAAFAERRVSSPRGRWAAFLSAPGPVSTTS
mmetsp:Transcript_5777/g.11542  ORF Transcript_5777/g.11542 Transcript_5777/m.11542 type:complete len:153 (-) Transcript_5777:77-535(-)